MSKIAERVKARIEALGLNHHETARLAGLEKSYVSDLILERKKTIRHDSLVALARVLDCDPEYLAGDQDLVRNGHRAPDFGMPLVGIVEPGVWRSVDASHTLSNSIPVGIDFRFDGMVQRAYLARGDDMKSFGIEDGMRVATVDYQQFRAAHVLKNGDLVVTLKRRDNNRESQRCIRKVKYQQGKPFLFLPNDAPPLEGDHLVEGVVVKTIRVFGFDE